MGRRDEKVTLETSRALSWLADGLETIAKRRFLSIDDLRRITGLDREFIEALLNRQLDADILLIEHLMATLDVSAEELFAGFGRQRRLFATKSGTESRINALPDFGE